MWKGLHGVTFGEELDLVTLESYSWFPQKPVLVHCSSVMSGICVQPMNPDLNELFIWNLSHVGKVALLHCFLWKLLWDSPKYLTTIQLQCSEWTTNMPEILLPHLQGTGLSGTFWCSQPTLITYFSS